MLAVTEFKISKLFGKNDIALKFRDNMLILVGENGSGKTTILRIMYLFLSGRWTALLKYDFKNISVSFADASEVSLEKREIGNLLKKLMKDSRFLHRFPPHIRHRYFELFEEDIEFSNLFGEKNKEKIPVDYFLHRLPPDFAFQLQSKELEVLQKALDKTAILYLPTYRRIEKELSAIFRGVDADELRNKGNFRDIDISTQGICSYEKKEFGMHDITSSIEHVSNELNRFAVDELNQLTLHYLSDVLEQKYKEVNVSVIKNAPQESIDNIWKRIDSNILSKSSLKKLSDTINDIRNEKHAKTKLDEHESVICHYFTKLLDFQKELDKKEERIKNFCKICNAYLIGKKFYYDSASFKAYIQYENRKDQSFDLEYLSSGEKQIVSLFGNLYLATDDNFFIMIDEPELSLSVPWQKRFLVDIHNANFCEGIVAVTHSPFIFENELEPYVHGVGEFLHEC